MNFNQAMRDVYCQTLIELAEKDDRIMILEADLMRAAGTVPFKNAFPERAIEVGIAESNMVGIAAGLSAMGKVPFAATFGCFAARRTFDQFFLSANYAQLNVNLVGMDPGITAAFNGGTHMPFEDLGMMNLIPKLTISEPADQIALNAMLKINAETYGSSYMRLFRKDTPLIYKEGETFAIGKGKVLKDGNDITILAVGPLMLNEALKAEKMLAEKGVDAAVIDPVTVKPLDKELIVKYAKKTKSVITAENHQISGGFPSMDSCLLAKEYPVKMDMVGIDDQFGQVGTMDWLQKEYKLTAEEITSKALKLLNK